MALLILGFVFPAMAGAESGSMTFRVVPLETGRGGAGSSHVIVADGIIEKDTPQAFVDFLRTVASDASLRRIVFFNSRGGNVEASLALGRVLREQRVTGVVGRFEGGGSGPYSGECMSACVYAMMGAVKRVAPPGSEVVLHRMATVKIESTAGGEPARITRSFDDPSMDAALKRYAHRMGVNPALVGQAQALPPDGVHTLTPEEIRRWSFAYD